MFRKKSIVRRPRKTLKRGGSYKKRSLPTKSLVRLIKKVALKPVETKQAFSITENIALYHNSVNIKQDLLYTKQGITDNDNGTSSNANRIGDSVVARGLSIKLWIANKDDRPNVMYRIVVFSYTAGDTVTASDIYNTGTANFMLKSFNTEKIKIITSKVINCQLGISTVPLGGTGGKEAHRLVKFWVPMKNRILKYDNDNSGTPKWTDIGFAIVPYDSYGTLTTDNIASYSFYSKFYFKDP